MLLTFDGGDPIDKGAVPPAEACDASCTTYVGAGYLGPGRLPAGSTRVLAFATWASEATAAQASAFTFPTGNRFVLPEAVRAAAVVDLQPSRDWNGAASTLTTLGSAPVTLGVAGALRLFPVAEARYVADSAYYVDSRQAEPNVDSGGYAWTVRNPYAHLRAQTDAEYVSAEAYATIYWNYPYPELGSYVNGIAGASVPVPLSRVPIPGTAHPAQIATFYVGAGAAKVVDLWEGSADTNDYFCQQYFRAGTFIQALRLPTLLTDGVTSANSSMLRPPPPPAHRVVLLMDEAEGWYTVDPERTSVLARLRQSYPYPTDGIAEYGGASLAMAEFAIRADSVSSIVAQLDGTSTNAVWIGLGMLDYGGPTGDSAAHFQNAYQGVVNGICSGKPGTQLYLQSPLQRVAPATESANDYGNTLGDYRTAVQSIATGSCPAGCSCTYVNCGGGACVSNANMDGNTGIYLTNAGVAQLENVIASTLEGAGLLY
jgi:hypothetical protein